jgi:hypothetical protein
MTTGETGIRSVAARVIAEHQGAVLLHHKDYGYEFTGLLGRTSVFCKTWPEAERVLLRMKVPPSKIEAALLLLKSGKDVLIRPATPEEAQ